MRTFFLLTCLSFLFIQSNAQDKYLDIEPDGKLNLQGKWTAECASEYVNSATFRNCDLCPFVIDPKDHAHGEIKSIEMIFSYDSLTIKRPDKTVTVAYTMNSDTHTIQFQFNGEKEIMRVFYNRRNVILIEQDGFPVTLRRGK